MHDINGVPLVAGQKVVFIPQNGYTYQLSQGTVKSLTPHKVRIAVTGKAWSYSRSEEHTSELQSLMRISYAVFCLKKKKQLHLAEINDTTLKLDQNQK